MTILETICHNKKAFAAAAVLLMLALVTIRLACIEADPPPDLSISGALYSDEGFKTFAARNMALFGDWKWTPRDGYDGWVTKSPLSQYTYVAIFRLLGTGFMPVRIVSVVYSVLALALFFLFLRARFGNETALTGLALFGFNYFNVMFGRMGFYETHIVFYMALSIWAFSAMTMTGTLPRRTALALIALAGIAASWYIKRSIAVSAVALAPALALWAMDRLGLARTTQRRIFAALLIAAGASYMLAAHCDFAQPLVGRLLAMDLGGTTLNRFFSFRALETLPAALGRGLYLEFVFLQPLTFFVAAAYSLLVFYRYFRKDDPLSADLVFACWFVFGFLILGAMKYHPARYYLIFTPALSVLAVRGLMTSLPALADFLQGPKPPIWAFFSGSLKAYAVLCVVVVIVVQAVPFGVRNKVIQSLYGPLSQGDTGTVVPYALAVLGLLATTLAALTMARTRIYAIMRGRGTGLALAALIIAGGLAQYGRWAACLSHENHALSVRLGEKLPANAIIAGSWSAQLVIENRLRALIMQDKSRYNHDVMEALLRGESIPVTDQSKSTAPVMEKNQPLYLAVCPGMVFERTITEKYARFITDDRYVDGADLGYFTIKVYRVR